MNFSKVRWWRVRILLLTLVFSSELSATVDSRFDCKYQSYFLTLESSIGSAVSHTLLINGKYPIQQLKQGNWFIEQVNCTKSGYDIVASRVQLGDKTKRTFRLNYNGKQHYTLR